ncbi:MAG: c-type cytochrome [Sandaracinaceae bacterium]|nr:c-type cytochrome [Sandaracinaceae bacterium]
MSRSLVGIVAALAVACTDPAPPTDAGADADTPPPDATIDGPAYAFVREEACFSVASDGAVEWVFGDGATATGREACHAFEIVGVRTIGAVVVDARGRRAEATRSVSVVPRPSDPAPTSSSSIAVDAARGRVWVVNPDADTVAVLSIEPLALVTEVTVGEHPRALAIAGARVAVACQGDDTLRLLDAETLEPRSTVAAGSEPWAVLADPRGGAFFVASRAGTVTSVDPDGAILDALAVGPEPRGLAMNADGALIATRWRSDEAGARVVSIDARDPRALALGPETVLARQEGLDSDTDNDGVLSFLGQAVPSPDGRRVVLPALKANVVAGAFRTGLPLTSQTTARAALGEVLLGAPGAEARDSFRHSFDDLDFASAAVYAPMGDRLFVAMQGAQTVVVVDGFDFFTVASIDAVGEAPQGLALSPDGSMLFVQAFLSRTVRVYDVSSFATEPPLLAEIPTLAAEPLEAMVLEGKRIFYRSRDPRMSRTRYLSCATCHLDGEGDGLVWDFTQRGEGLRNTIELRGRAGRAPLHWTANFDEVQDFEHDIRGGQGGEGFLPDDVFHAMMRDETLGGPKAGLSPELDALAAYVASLDRFGTSPYRAIDDDAARARGAALFEGAGCPTCHAGEAYTDSAFVGGEPVLHDVGTLGAGSGSRLGGPLTGLDTPTLRGLWRTAPYLHDGSAPTLREVLTTRNAADTHGVTSSLTDAEIDDLVAFLRSLDDGA